MVKSIWWILDRKLSVSRLRISSAPRFFLPNFGYVIGQAGNSQFSASLVNRVSPYAGIGLPISCKRLYSCRAVKKDPNQRDISSDLLEEANATADVLNVDSKDAKETQMDKISHGNKGRVPWNKGRKHSEGKYFQSSAYRDLFSIGLWGLISAMNRAETRERISRNTKEALKDPKVKSCKNQSIWITIYSLLYEMRNYLYVCLQICITFLKLDYLLLHILSLFIFWNLINGHTHLSNLLQYNFFHFAVNFSS